MTEASAPPLVRNPDQVNAMTEFRQMLRHGRLSLWVFGLAMAGSLLTAMVALGAVGSGGSPEGPEQRREGAAKRLDAPLNGPPGVLYVDQDRPLTPPSLPSIVDLSMLARTTH